MSTVEKYAGALASPCNITSCHSAMLALRSSLRIGSAAAREPIDFSCKLAGASPVCWSCLSELFVSHRILAWQAFCLPVATLEIFGERPRPSPKVSKSPLTSRQASPSVVETSQPVVQVVAHANHNHTHICANGSPRIDSRRGDDRRRGRRALGHPRSRPSTTSRVRGSCPTAGLVAPTGSCAPTRGSARGDRDERLGTSVARAHRAGSRRSTPTATRRSAPVSSSPARSPTSPPATRCIWMACAGNWCVYTGPRGSLHPSRRSFMPADRWDAWGRFGA